MLTHSQGCWKRGPASAPSRMGCTGALRVPLHCHSRLLPVRPSAARNGQHEGISGRELRDVCLSKAGAGVLSALLLLGSVQPSAAVDLGTLQQQQQQQAAGNPYTSLAKPLPKQSVDKKRVWTILLGGAVVLFTSTLVVENLEGFFPAIARANKAMALSRKKAEQQERKQSQADADTLQAVAAQQQQQQQQQQLQQQSSAAVEAGLAEARQKVLGGSSPAPQASQASAPAPPSASYPSQLDSGPVQGPTSNSMTSSNSENSSSNSSSSSNNGSDDGPGAPPAAPQSRSPEQEGGAQASTASAASAESASIESAGEGARSEGGATTSNGSSSTNSSSGGKVYLSNEEINAARSMRMQLGEPGASSGAAEAESRAAGSADAAAVALQPGTPAGDNDSAAAAAAAVAVAVGSNASKTARLEKFVGGVMREGNQAGFLSGMKQGGRSPRS